MSMVVSIFVAAYAISIVWESFLSILNYKYWTNDKHINHANKILNFSGEKIHKNLAYNKVSYTFSHTVKMLTSVGILAFMLLGGYGYLESFSKIVVHKLGLETGLERNLENSLENYTIAIGMILMLSISALGMLKGVLEEYYSTFVIDKKYQLARASLKDFFVNKGVSLIGSMVFSFVIFYVVLWIIQNYEYWWFLCSVAITLCFLIFHWIHIEHIVNRFLKNHHDLDKEHPLWAKVQELCAKDHVKLDKVIVFKTSKSSKKIGASVSGLFGRSIFGY